MFLRHAARAALFFYGVLVVLRAAIWWSATARPDPSSLPIMLTWPLLFGALAAGVITLLRRPSLETTAAVIDARAQTRDRLLSAREFSSRGEANEMERLAVGETAEWLKTRDLRPHVPIRFPSELKWLLVPLATLALLWWSELDRAAQRDAAVAAARKGAGPTARALENLAKQTEERAKAIDSEELRRIADRLKQSAAQLRAEADRAGDTETAALREIAELEQLARELRQPQAATPGELKAIAEALRKHEGAKEAAKALEENRPAEAAERLETARQSPEAKEIEATLQQAVEHLARRQEEASKQIAQLQQQQANARGQNDERTQLMQQLAQMLRQMPQKPQQPQPGQAGGEQKEQQPQQGGGKQMSDEDLKKLLSALQDLKDQQGEGEQQEGQGHAPGEQKTDAPGNVSVLSFQQSKQLDPSSSLPIPSGQPGPENDTGTTRDPFGQDATAQNAAKRSEQLQGQLGEGESLSALVPAAAKGDARAAQRYRELTEAAAAAAQDTVEQEAIPLGSRFLIKRYFEAIRARQ